MASMIERAETSAYVIDRDYRIVYSNETSKSEFPGIFDGATCFRVLRGFNAPCEDCPLRLVSGGKTLVYNQVTESWVEIEVSDIEWPGVGPCHILLCRKVAGPEIEAPRQEERDVLTGLRSRLSFLHAAADVLATHPDQRYCLMVIDIEHFKLFNELYGEEEGDRFLREVGELLSQTEIECGGVAGYLLGDDFCMVLPRDETVIEHIQDELTKKARRYGKGVGFLPSFGLYAIDDRSLPVSTMHDRALLALASIKGNYAQRACWYDDEMMREMEDDHALLLGVQRALENGEIMFYAQPKCSMASGKIVGLEALVRWIHPERGVIPPSEFVPMLERNGLITTLDLYVWEQVCRALKEWIGKGHIGIPISVNVSRRDMYAIDVVDTFVYLTNKYDLDPALLEVEITESAFVEDYEKISTIVDRLREAGFTVLMDDFGSGYSSLGMLKDVNVDILKLDIKLLDLSDRSGKGRRILESTISMARLLDLRLVAEGVETEDQRDFLLKAGCLYAQGYYFYRPQSREQIEELLLNQENVDLRGIQVNPIGRLQVRQLLNDSVLSDTMMDDILGPIAFYDMYDGRVEVASANDQYCRLMGMDLIEVQEQRTDIAELVYEADRDDFYQALEQAFCNAPEGAAANVRRMRKDGETVVVHVRLFFLRERDGHRLFYGSVSDVTDQLSKARLLESSQRALAAVVEVSSHDPSFMSLDEENRRAAAVIFAQMTPGGMIGGYCEEGFPLYFANAEMVKLLGYDSYEEFVEGIGGLVGNTIHPDDQESVARDIGPEYYAGLEYTTTYRMPKKDGTWFWTLDKGRVVEAEDGRLAIVSACTDITDVMSAQQRLAERNKLLLSRNKELAFLNEDMPGGYHRCLYSPGFDFLYMSDRFLDLVGYTREEIQELFDDKFANMVHPDDQALVAECVNQLKKERGSTVISLEYRMKTKNGYMWVVDQSRYLEYEGRAFLQGVVVDITETVELRNAIRALADHSKCSIAVLSWSDRDQVKIRVDRCEIMRSFGFTTEEGAVRMEAWLRTPQDEVHGCLLDRLVEAVEQGEEFTATGSIVLPDGAEARIRIEAYDISEQSSEHRALCLCTDVTAELSAS